MTNTQNITFANAPTWGATGIQHALADDPLVSIHAPTWGATGLVSQTLHFRGVSIHALTWGATLQYILVEPVALFQPTLPHGERPLIRSFWLVPGLFQPTLPHGERP